MVQEINHIVINKDHTIPDFSLLSTEFEKKIYTWESILQEELIFSHTRQVGLLRNE